MDWEELRRSRATRSDGDVMLEVRQLTRFVADKPIVENVSFAVRRGETLALVGPSGAGKSSLLRMLNRLDEPSSGTVLLEGVDYTTLSPRDLRRRVGMVMQQAYLFPGTVAENVAFGPASRGESVSAERVRELLERVNLAGYEQRDIGRLSGGEAQRVSLARTLMNDPHVLLLDEPTSALDEDTRFGVEELIQEIARERNLTSILVTHDMDQAARMATRVAVLEAGTLRQIGPAEEVLKTRDA
ncbi:MAG: phosphate ABC transporter ATP-binding protein [Alicyclobacillus sp.]|nr:phosphate ABC transporter ATP-binding protein [Alicyclobacillus sp.]